MASSTVNSVPVANNSSGNASTQNSGSRPSLRTTTNKSSDGGRRQTGSPADGGQRRSNSQKAWTQGTNPITQRPSFSNQNGIMSQKPSTSPKPSVNESNTSDNHANDRLLFLAASFIGLATSITTKNGDEFTGIFSASSLESADSSITLKMTQRQSKQDQQRSNGVSDAASPFLGSAPDHAMTFNLNDVVDVYVPSVTTTDVLAKPNGASTGFRTDADISGNLAMRERTLKRWEPGTDANTDLSLESTTPAKNNWDQFETNARLFGATSSYNEELYTTRIDRSDPTYKQKEAEAARIAREIETSEVDNAHVREERGLQAPDAGDEEDKYSGVRRDEKSFPPLASGQPNKYTPPALRNSNQLTATAPAYTGGPVKRAISTKEAVPAPVQAKETAPVQPLATPVATNAGSVAESERKAAPSKTSSTTPAATKGPTTEINYEVEVADRFRQFAKNERSKLDLRRKNQVAHDRSTKLNELLKFSRNFKLATPVPKDLVPILAKDPHKQEAIIQRAQQSSDDKKTPDSTPPASTVEQKKPTDPAQLPARQGGGAPAPQAPSDRPTYPRGRQGYPPTGPQGALGGRVQHHQPFYQGRQATGMLGHRLADNLQQRKGAAAGAVPAPLPIQEARVPSTDQSNVSSPSKVLTPTSSASTKFNVRAMEFKPNPAASTFTPGASNAASGFVRPESRAKTPPSFFDVKNPPRPISERPSLKDQFNPIKRMKKEGAEQTERNLTSNGGIPFAYSTLPTWHDGDEERSYVTMFRSSPASPQRSTSNPQIPHQPHLPYQFQQGPNMPPTSGPPHGPHLHPQQHHGSGPPHFDDPHRMQMSASTSQMFPSPRLQHGYPSPMAPHAQLAFGQQPVPQFYMNQGGPQPAHMRHYQGAPQFVNPQGAMSAPMMVQQPSGGPYMGVPQAPFTPQMQMYSPNPGHVFPHVPPPPQPHGGYPSPSRGAAMMMHQNSQPGQPPQHVMYMSPGQHQQPVYAGQQPNHMPPGRGNYPQQQPHFQSSPHQAHHYPPHQHRTPSSGFNQIPQMPPPMAAPPPPAAGGQGQETADESK
ncbi:putative PAB1 binding protein (Pbp1) [Aspergillus stella-maris]|uniref:putative PAB1 binding protein (Pbp1) n=1 Tax=Aspergillus stella-maris TaxID=1810926 RepID=UPI003CCCCA9F